MQAEETLIPVDELDRWTCAWYRAAVENRFVSPPYHPDEATLKRLVDCFEAGLTPREAVQMMFCARH